MAPSAPLGIPQLQQLQDLAKYAFKSAVPVNIRALASAISGDRAGITTDDLWLSDKEALYRAASRQAATTGKTSGDIGYGDYGAKPSEFSDFTGGDLYGAHSGIGLIDAIIKSYTDPKFRMETTLGMARYKVNPDKSVSISDRYDFNAPRKIVNSEITKNGKLGTILNAYRNVGFEGAANAAGNIYAGADGEGLPYQVNLSRPPMGFGW